MFDETRVKEFFKNAEKGLLDFIPNRVELIANCVDQLKYENFSSIVQKGPLQEYTPFINYNLTGIVHFTKTLFADPSFTFFYSDLYKLRTLIPILANFLEREPSKTELVKPLIDVLIQTILDADIEAGSIDNINYFNV